MFTRNCDISWSKFFFKTRDFQGSNRTRPLRQSPVSPMFFRFKLFSITDDSFRSARNFPIAIRFGSVTQIFIDSDFYLSGNAIEASAVAERFGNHSCSKSLGLRTAWPPHYSRLPRLTISRRFWNCELIHYSGD
jgi:hypothetical protein